VTNGRGEFRPRQTRQLPRAVSKLSKLLIVTDTHSSKPGEIYMCTFGGRIRQICLRGLQVVRFSVPCNGTLWGDGLQGYRYCVDCYMRQMDLHAFSRVKDSAAVPLWEEFSSDTFDVQLERLLSAWG